MSEGHRFLSDEQIDQLGRNQGQAAWAPGYPKIPNVEHDRKEIDHDAVIAFMPVGEPIVNPEGLQARKLFTDMATDEQMRWTVAFTVPALFARVRNLEAQVLTGQQNAEHWEREARALESRLNVPFVTDRRAGAYRLQIRETSKSEDRKCFGLPTVLHVQSYVPRTDFHLQNGDAVYEGKYVLLEDHRGLRAGTYAADAETAIESLTSWLPGQFTAREDPHVIARAAEKELKVLRDLRKELVELRSLGRSAENLLGKAQAAVIDAQKGKAVKTNLKSLQSLLGTILDRVIEMREEDQDGDIDDESSLL